MEPTLKITQHATGYCIVGNSLGLTQLASVLENLAAIGIDRRVDHHIGDMLLMIGLKDSTCDNCISKRPDSKNCLPLALVYATKLPDPCPAWQAAPQAKPKPRHTITFAELYDLPLKLQPALGSPLHNIRLTAPRAGEAWTPDEDKLLEEAAHKVGTSDTQLPKLAALFKRQVGGIISRLFKLGIIAEKRFINSRYNTAQWRCESPGEA